MSRRAEDPFYESVFIDIERPPSTRHRGIYKYRPLDDPSTDIRLLHLLPRQSNRLVRGRNVITCELRPYCMGREPPYASLSYTWGDASIRRQLFICARQCSVTESLYTALEHLQDDSKTLTLWVDAICINQADETEKNAQVQRMGRIYSSAAVVLAWLDVAAEDSDVAIQSAFEISKALPDDELSSATLRGEMSVPIPVDSIQSLFRRPWFQRVWVRQEVALNVNAVFICGYTDIPVAILIRVQLHLLASGSSPSEDFSHLTSGGLKFMGQKTFEEFLSEPFTQVSLLMNGRYLKATEPRDYVFSLFEFISDTENSGLFVNYSKSVEAVYSDFAVAIVQAQGFHYVLALWSSEKHYTQLPSWVPDWSTTSPQPRVQVGDKHALALPVHINGTKSGRQTLRLSCEYIDRLASVETNTFDIENNATYRSTTDLAAKERLQAIAFLNTLENLINTVMKDATDVNRLIYESSITMSALGQGVESSNGRRVFDSYCALRGFTPSSDIQELESEEQDSGHLHMRVLRGMYARHIFVTEKGFVGLSDNIIQPGDCVFVFQNAGGPWILRRLEEGSYRMIARAYVYNIEELLGSGGNEGKIVIS